MADDHSRLITSYVARGRERVRPSAPWRTNAVFGGWEVQPDRHRRIVALEGASGGGMPVLCRAGVETILEPVRPSAAKLESGGVVVTVLTVMTVITAAAL